MPDIIIPQKTQIQNLFQHSHDETILVIKRTHLFKNIAPWQGLKQVDFDHYLHIVNHKKEFHPRHLMEYDPNYKQIIPYLIFMYKGSIFLMQRQSTASEQRLKNKLTIGIGGHVRKEDIIDTSLFSWARREFYEEISYDGTCSVEPLGIINDDSNEVGRVHVGFVLLLKGDSDSIAIKSELKSGKLVSLQECVQQREYMESWSQFVIDTLALNM